jgi:hypothetical protein
MVIPTPKTVTSMADFFEEMEGRDQRLFEFDDDPIAAAYGSYDNWLRGGNRWMDLKQVRISQQDRDNADQLRKYYSGRLTMQALCGRPMTEFRRKLYAILNDNYDLKLVDIGMIMRLPYFHQEDMEIDSVIENTVSVTVPGRPIDSEEKMLFPFKRIMVGRRHGESIQFWWHDSQNHGVVLSVKTSDPLLSFVESVFEQPRMLRAKFYPVAHRWITQNHNYYRLLQPRIV